MLHSQCYDGELLVCANNPIRVREKHMVLTLLGDPEVTANIYCKLRNLPNTDTQNHSTDLR